MGWEAGVKGTEGGKFVALVPPLEMTPAIKDSRRNYGHFRGTKITN